MKHTDGRCSGCTISRQTKMKSQTFLKGYKDLFDEDGADPLEVKKRAKEELYWIKLTKKETQKLINERIEGHWEDIEELNKTIRELKNLCARRKSPRLRQLIGEKCSEKKKIKDWIRLYRTELQVIEKTFNVGMELHQEILEKLKAPSVERKMDYVG